MLLVVSIVDLRKTAQVNKFLVKKTAGTTGCRKLFFAIFKICVGLKTMPYFII